MKKVIFVTYASGTYKENIFWNKLFVSLFVRPDISLCFTDEDLKKTEIYHSNKDIFDAKTGGGYWAWKPWVILEAMKVAKEGDIILYQDCGKGFRYKNFKNPKSIINYTLKNDVMPGISVPIHGHNEDWTHKKCFELMDCCESKYYNSPQVEAVVSAWKVGAKSKKFVEEWLSYSLRLEVIGEQLDSNGKKVPHRYDQSILTNLVLKHKLKPVRLSFDDMHFSKSMSLVDLDLGKDNILNKILLNIILTLFRIKRTISYRLG